MRSSYFLAAFLLGTSISLPGAAAPGATATGDRIEDLEEDGLEDDEEVYPDDDEGRDNDLWRILHHLASSGEEQGSSPGDSLSRRLKETLVEAMEKGLEKTEKAVNKSYGGTVATLKHWFHITPKEKSKNITADFVAKRAPLGFKKSALKVESGRRRKSSMSKKSSFSRRRKSGGSSRRRSSKGKSSGSSAGLAAMAIIGPILCCLLLCLCGAAAWFMMSKKGPDSRTYSKSRNSEEDDVEMDPYDNSQGGNPVYAVPVR